MSEYELYESIIRDISESCRDYYGVADLLQFGDDFKLWGDFGVDISVKKPDTVVDVKDYSVKEIYNSNNDEIALCFPLSSFSVEGQSPEKKEVDILVSFKDTKNMSEIYKVVDAMAYNLGKDSYLEVTVKLD